jgi:hypothetical protein
MNFSFDMLLAFFFQNIIFFIIIGGLIIAFLYLFKFKKAVKFKIIDREEVERMKFIEAMQFNKTDKYKTISTADIKYLNGGKGLINNPMIVNKKMLASIENYLEFEQRPIKIVEKEGKYIYEEDKTEKPMKLIGMVIQRKIMFGLIPIKKPHPLLIEQSSAVKDDKTKTIFIPQELGFDRFMGYYYAINENMKPKIRNIMDARVLSTDFNITCSRYYAKSLEQCVYAPEVALQQAQKQTDLSIELAKSRGISKTT